VALVTVVESEIEVAWAIEVALAIAVASVIAAVPEIVREAVLSEIERAPATGRAIAATQDPSVAATGAVEVLAVVEAAIPLVIAVSAAARVAAVAVASAAAASAAVAHA
jgi:hypothetical protein